MQAMQGRHVFSKHWCKIQRNLHFLPGRNFFIGNRHCSHQQQRVQVVPDGHLFLCIWRSGQHKLHTLRCRLLLHHTPGYQLFSCMHSLQCRNILEPSHCIHMHPLPRRHLPVYIWCKIPFELHCMSQWDLVLFHWHQLHSRLQPVPKGWNRV